MGKFEEIKKEIEKIVAQSDLVVDPAHSKNTLEWLLRLKPDADEALQIAALAHDIERGYDRNQKEHSNDPREYEEYRQKHPIRSAQITVDLMKEYSYEENMIVRVQKLVENHETGGYEDADILRDADSLSFLETNFDNYLMRKGKERTKQKVNDMYNRMSERSKEIGKDLYRKCLSKLNN